MYFHAESKYGNKSLNFESFGFFSLSWKIFTNRLLLITVLRGLTELICCWTCTPCSCFKFNLLWNTVLMPYLNLLHLYWMTRNYTGAAGYHFLFGFIKLLFLLDFFFFFQSQSLTNWVKIQTAQQDIHKSISIKHNETYTFIFNFE